VSTAITNHVFLAIQVEEDIFSRLDDISAVANAPLVRKSWTRYVTQTSPSLGLELHMFNRCTTGSWGQDRANLMGRGTDTPCV